MQSRLTLHEIFVTLMGSRNVYFQPPPSFEMKYPCIVYNLDNFRTNFADNQHYIDHCRYSVTIIDNNPDSPLIEKMAKQPMTSFDRHFTSEGLNHNVFITYY